MVEKIDIAGLVSDSKGKLTREQLEQTETLLGSANPFAMQNSLAKAGTRKERRAAKKYQRSAEWRKLVDEASRAVLEKARAGGFDAEIEAKTNAIMLAASETVGTSEELTPGIDDLAKALRDGE